MDSTSSAELTRHDLGLELRPRPLPQTTPTSFEVPKRAQQSINPPSIFPQFSELPFELRTQIWQYAVAQPRIVEIHKAVVKITLNEPTFPWDSPPKDIIRHYRSKTHDPPLISTCHESREIALPIYKKILSVRVMNGGIYMDFKHDTIFLTPETLCWIPPHNTFKDPGYRYRLSNHIHSVAFDARQFVDTQGGQESPSGEKIASTARACIRGPRVLKEMILVLNDDGTSVREEQLAVIDVHTPIPATEIATLLQDIVSVFEQRVVALFPALPAPGRGGYKHGQKQYMPPKIWGMVMRPS